MQAEQERQSKEAKLENSPGHRAGEYLWKGAESSGPSVEGGKRMQGPVSFVTNVGKIHTTEESSDDMYWDNAILNLS